MPAPSPAAAPAHTPTPTCEIWIRNVGSRRQAFVRCFPKHTHWQKISVPQADRALKEGKVASGPFAGIPLVSRETANPTHPRREAFAEQAHVLNRQIDAMNARARHAT
ncbi:hypothetical protein QTH87_05890 [Variovorax sp. J22P168]|uniref:hypothetical protein n=1 Tax=Variovorax jilinensis TaxID=3053513 RepID=UPI0025750F94|nr:hypothetical protein [Variovorax sp. J22P168]MDM0011969.1 hypothetical protein [Variovorax sp. J22P168]